MAKNIKRRMKKMEEERKGEREKEKEKMEKEEEKSSGQRPYTNRSRDAQSRYLGLIKMLI